MFVLFAFPFPFSFSYSFSFSFSFSFLLLPLPTCGGASGHSLVYFGTLGHATCIILIITKNDLRTLSIALSEFANVAPQFQHMHHSSADRDIVVFLRVTMYEDWDRYPV